MKKEEIKLKAVQFERLKRAMIDNLERIVGESSDSVLNKDDVCGMLSCAQQTLNRYMKEGLPYHKLKSSKAAPIYYVKSEIIQWVKSKNFVWS